MLPGIENRDIKDSEYRRVTEIDGELQRLNLDIVALQETRIEDMGKLQEKNFTFFWKGLPPGERRIHGVGFAVRNSLVGATSTPTGHSERLMSLCLETRKGKAHFISAYAPTLDASSEDKDKFYDSLRVVVSSIPKGDALFLLGDFNARVGQDHSSWPDCLGHHGIGNMNDNGERLLQFCSSNGLCITNTYFTLKHCHKVSWRHPRSKHWHQLDFVITRKTELQSVKITRALQSADCSTDHSLIFSKVKLEPKRVHSARPAAKPKIDVSSLNDGEKKEAFCREFMSRMEGGEDEESVDRAWTMLKTNLYESAILCFGKRKKTSRDWVEANSETLLPLIDRKREAMIEHKRNPSKENHRLLKEAKSTVQRESRRCANEYWTNLCQAIQTASDFGDSKTVYSLMKTALGPEVTKAAPLKSEDGAPIADTQEQLQRWVQHYSNLYSTEIPAKPGLEEAIPQFGEFSELDEEPTLKELEDAIKCLSSGKATGEDNIPAEILKENRDVLLPHLYKLLLLCWHSRDIPHEMRNAKIITLYKNKGDKGDCNNYRGIALQSITGKAFARILLTRLQKLAERILPESQCGFRAGRSTMDMVFSLRQLQEKCREQQMPLYIAFVDLTKAFDTVSRPSLYKVLKRIGCPPTLLQLIISFHEDMTACIQYEGNISDRFDVKSGVKQGCVLAPTLFGIYFAALLHHAFKDSQDGVFIRTRSDGSMFNIRRLKSKTKTTLELIRELLFADDAALTAHTEAALQRLMDCLASACELFQLTISIKKTEVLAQGVTTPPKITLNGNILNTVDKFVYLGSTISSTLSLEDELKARIGKAATAFGKLMKRAWENRKLTKRTKILIYQTCVLSTLLYGSEAWTLYADQERKLNGFHMRCLRKILRIDWKDKVTNTQVLQLANIPSLYQILRHRRMRWLGHVHRMDCHRIPRQLLYGELLEGTRPTGAPMLRHKDLSKRTMSEIYVNPNTWEKTAQDRKKWRSAVHSGVRRFEEERIQRVEEDRRRRKNPVQPTADQFVYSCNYCNRRFTHLIGKSSHERACSNRR